MKGRSYQHCFFIFLLYAFLRNCFLCWDLWNGDVMPTLDAALLSSMRAGSDLGRVSGLVEELFSIIIFPNGYYS